MVQLGSALLNLQLAVFTLTIAVFLVGVVSIVFPRLARYTRARDFELARMRADAEVRETAARFHVPDATPIDSAAVKIFRAQQGRVRRVHDQAREAQEIYRDRVVRCVASLWLAIIATALSATVFHDAKELKPYVAALDLVAMLWVFHQWWSALAENYRWAALRIKAELLRQENFLTAVFAPANADVPSDADIDRRFAEREKEMDETVIAPKPMRFRAWLRSLVRTKADSPSTEKALRSYWGRRRAYLAPNEDGAASFAPNDLLQYIHSRPLDQFRWFRRARYRLRRSGQRRAALLACLFVTAILLAAVKMAFTHVDEASVQASTLGNLLSFAVFAITASSAALTSLYLGRNDRSLLHRYAAQERRIEDWLGGFLPKVPGIGTLLAAPVSRSSLTEDVLSFEDLMIDELVDWLHISQHDTIELAP